MVFDVGHYSIRAGFAGEDSLKAEVPSYVGFLDGSDPNAMETQPPLAQEKKYFIDTTAIHVPRKGVEIISFLKDGQSK